MKQPCILEYVPAEQAVQTLGVEAPARSKENALIWSTVCFELLNAIPRIMLSLKLLLLCMKFFETE